MEAVYIPKTEEIFNAAVKKSRLAAMDSGIKNPLRRRKVLEAERIKLAANCMVDKLGEIGKVLPHIDSMNPFYRELLEITLETGKLKKALAHVLRSQKLIKKLHYECKQKVFSAAGKEGAIKRKREFFGRAESVLGKLQGSIDFLREAMRTIRKFPSLKFDMPSVILSGFPNVGKTTLLRKLTGSKSKVASYPFTTTELNVGYFEAGYLPVQVIDVPGLLDREESKRNAVERRAVAALRYLADEIVFVLDASESCGYGFTGQLKLMKDVRARFKRAKFLVVVNKVDLLSSEQLREVMGKVKGAVLEGLDRESRLREEVARVLKEKIE